MFRRYRKWTHGEFVLVGCDTAAGAGDYCAAQFLSRNKLDVPLVYHSKSIASDMTPALFEELERIYSETGIPPLVTYERNNGGVFELERLASLNRLNKYRIALERPVGDIENAAPHKLGWSTNTATRPKMLADLKDAIDHKLIKLYDRQTVSELFSFIIVQTSSARKAQAEKSAHDDLIMSLAITWQLYQTELPPPSNWSRVAPKENLFNQGFY